jgi:drug/metabolite transporter (DMT)-like permease
VACGILGVVLIQQPHGAGPANASGVVIALVASVTTAIAMLGLHRLKGVDARAVVAHFSGVASLSMALALVAARSLAEMAGSLDARSTLLLLGVGLSGTLGQILLTKAYASGPPAKIAVLSLTQVVFGLGFDVLLQGRRMTAPTLLGFVMVLGPTAWITSRAARARRDPVSSPSSSRSSLGDVVPKQRVAS